MLQSTRARRLSLILGFLCFVLTDAAQAAITYTWETTTNGASWSTPGDWSPTGPADGAGNIADFSQLNITANTTVNLDSNRTIGQLIFGDTTPSNNWILASTGGTLTLDNTGGTGQPKITVKNQTATITAALSGTNGFIVTGGNSTLDLNDDSPNLSGQITINSTSGTSNQFALEIGKSDALGGIVGTPGSGATIFSDPGASNHAVIELDAGVNLPNNITLNTANANGGGGGGSVMTTGDNDATVSGTITLGVNGKAASGGQLVGPKESTTVPNFAGHFLTITGQIIAQFPSTAKNITSTPNDAALMVRAGNVRLSGGGSYARIEERSGILQLGANNGVATNAFLDVGGNSATNPEAYSIFDLAGFNQQLVGLSNYVTNSTAATITNSSATTAATLTLTPGLGGDPNQANLAFVAGTAGTGTNANITDTSASAPLNLTVGHLTSGVPDATGTQYLITPNNSYRGVTTLLSGTLAISSLTNGGSNSSIGASSNAAANLVFSGGTLDYVNSYLTASNTLQAASNSITPSTDRNFTITTGSSGTIAVDSAATALTWSGGSAPTNGVLNKAGVGTLILTGTNQHTGGTNVNAGTLLVNLPTSGPGGILAGNVSVVNLATLGGNGSISGTVSVLSGGNLSPGNPSVSSGVGILTVGGLTLNGGSFTSIQFGSGNSEITDTGALTLNGGSINLFNAGGTTTFSTNGTYTLMGYNSLVGSLSNLSIGNPQGGKLYTLASVGNTVQLTIGTATIVDWNGSADGNWTNNGNWSAAFPNSTTTTARFDGSKLTGGSNTAITLNGNKTVAGLIFNDDSSSTGYTINGSDTLILNGGAGTSIEVQGGSQTINSPVSLSGATAVNFAGSGSSALTVSGAISGGTPLSIKGTGAMTLAGSNSYSTTLVNGSTLNVGLFGGGTSGTLGTGNVTISSGATLNFNRTDNSPGYAFSGAITGSGTNPGSVNQLGTGTTTIAGAITNVTSVNVSAGTLISNSTIGQTSGLNVTGVGGLGNTGSGSLTANGSISGAGALNVDTTGIVRLNASNSYSGGMVINNGTVVLGASGALPSGSALTINGDGVSNGGHLDLNGQSITLNNVGGNAIGGAITNSSTGTTSTINFTGNAASYDIFAALNDGTGVNAGKVALVINMPNPVAGSVINILHLHATGTYSGGTTVGSQSVEADANNAFGTGPITVALNNASTNASQIYLAPGVTIGNNITVAQGNPHPGQPFSTTTPEGVFQINGTGQDATLTGTITILANNVNDGLFNGPTAGNFLNVQGAVNVSGTADTIVQIRGQVKYSGGGNYPNMQINGLAALGAPNGLSQTAVLQFDAAPPGVGPASGTFDLNGFDQTVVGLTTTDANSAVQNSGTGPNTLTLNTSGTHTFSGSINGATNLTVAGTGTQVLTGSSSYTGVTTFSGTSVLQASNISTSGGSSSIGGASNDPSRLVFDGGTLQYTGTSSTSTDHGFTINSGKTAHIGVTTAGVNLTLTGTSPVSTGGFEKTGLGNLTFDGAATIGYTGSTTVTGGRLFVNNQLTSTSSVSVAAGATLAGSGTIGSPSSTFNHTAGTINPGVVGGASAGTLTIGNLTLAGGGVTYDVDDGQLSNQAAQDLVKINGVFNVTAATPIELDFLNPGASPTGFTYKLFQFGSTTTSLATLQSDLVFTTNLTAGRLTATPTFSGNTVLINVNVAAPGQLQWNSTSSGAWDTSTQNWFNTTSSLADKFVNGDQVTFADTTHGGSTPQNAITIAGTLSPSVFNITSNTVNYTFSGAGGIAGSGVLNISGNSTTTIKTNNSYSGGTNITSASAIVDVGGGGTSGTLGTGDVQNNGTLKFTRTDGNAVNPVTFVNNINGSGNLINSCPGTTVMQGNINQNTVTLNGSGTITLKGSISTSSSTAGIIVSGNTSADFQGSLNTNVSSGASLSVSGTSIVNIENGFNGSGGGINMSSTGSLTLTGSSGYDGNTVITAGTFFANDASAFGDTTGTTTVSGTGSISASFVSGTAGLDYGGEAISISGTGTSNSGAIHAGGGVTQTFEGTVTLAGDSLINLDSGSTLALSGTANNTALTGNHALTLAGAGTLSIGGTTVNLTSINTGTAGAALTFAPPPSGTLTVSSSISGGASSNLTFNTTNPNQATLGTTILSGNNSSFLGNLTVLTGNVQITAANQLGSGTGTITFTGDGGTPPPAANGTLIVASGSTISIANPLNLGARQGVAVNVPLIENVSGNTTFTGTTTLNSGGTDYTLQSDSGTLTIQSSMDTTPIGATNHNTRRLNLQGSGNGALNGVLTDVQDTAPGDANGNPIYITKSGSGTWTLGASSALHGNLTINDSGKLVIAAGKTVSFTDNPGGNGNLILNNPPTTAVVPGATPHISFGSTGTDTGSNLTVTNMNVPGTADTVLKLDNWTYGAGATGDHFIIANDPRSNIPQSQIQFTDFAPGYSYTTTATAARAVGEITPLIGDVNQDGHVDVNDISALLKALSDIGASGTTDVNSYAHQHPSFTNSDILFALDVDGDGKDTNADIQSLINYLIADHGSTSPVPEPTSFLLLGLGGALFLAKKGRKKFARTAKEND